MGSLRNTYVTEGIDVDVVRRQARERHAKDGEVTIVHFHPYDDNNDLCQHYPKHETYGAAQEEPKPL